jgi:hypothetical protein
MMARGRFSPDGFEPRVAGGVQRTPYKGYTLIGNDQEAVVFVNTTTAIAGPPDAVRSLIDQRGLSDGLPPVLRDLLKTVPAGQQVWLAAAGGLSALGKEVPPIGNLPNLSKVLSMLSSVVAAGDMRSGLKGFATGEAANDQDAKSLADALRGLIGLGRLTVPRNRHELVRVYDGLHVTQQRRSIRLDVAIPGDALDAFLDQFSAGSQPPRPR